MRIYPILPLIGGLFIAACADGGVVDPEPATTLVVSTSTTGEDPDEDGFQLTLDGGDPRALAPSGTVEVDLRPGRHTVQLVGVASQCSVTPGATLEVDIAVGKRTSVAFEVTCPLTGARIAVTTTGLDVSLDGYRVEVDGNDREAIR